MAKQNITITEQNINTTTEHYQDERTLRGIQNITRTTEHYQDRAILGQNRILPGQNGTLQRQSSSLPWMQNITKTTEHHQDNRTLPGQQNIARITEHYQDNRTLPRQNRTLPEPIPEEVWLGNSPGQGGYWLPGCHRPRSRSYLTVGRIPAEVQLLKPQREKQRKMKDDS